MNNLLSTIQSTKYILRRSKKLIDITNKMLPNRFTVLSKLLRQPYISLGHSDKVFSAVFSSDGKAILSGSGDNTIKLWDVASRKEIYTFEGHRDKIASVAFSPDGTKVLSGSLDKTLKLWDVASRKEIYTFEGHSDKIASVAFSPDGTKVLSGSLDKTLKLWDVVSGKEIRTFEGHSDKVYSVAFSPDGTKVLSGSWYKALKLWDVVSGREIRTFDGHMGPVRSVAFSPDGTKVLSGSLDKTLKLWDVASGKEIRTFEGHSDGVNSIAFSPDGIKVLSGSMDKTMKLWDVASGKEICAFAPFFINVYSVAFSPDGQNVLSSADMILKIWNIQNKKVVFDSYADRPQYIHSCVFSPDGTKMLSGSLDKTLKLWDVVSGREIRTFEGHTGWVYSVAFSPDGTKVLSGSWDKTLKVWDIHGGKEISSLEGHVDKVYSVAFSPDGNKVLSGSWDKTLKLWDAASGKEICTFEDHKDGVNSVAFSPDGSKVLSGSLDKTLKLWDVVRGKEIRTFEGHSDGVNSVAFSPDGSKVLSGSLDKTLKLWDVVRGKEIRTFEGHSDGVNSVAFSPDGSKVLSGSLDKTLKLWDVASGKEIRTFEGHSDGVNSIAFSPDGIKVLSESRDGTLKLWDVKMGNLIRSIMSFRDKEWITITSDGYFNHSPNARKYLTIRTSHISADEIDDATYEHYYRPNGLLDDKIDNEYIDQLEENASNVIMENDLLDRKFQESNPYQDLILELASIFEDYRKDEGLNPNPVIVERWINQFSPHNREVILSEMIHIFKRMYISEKKVDDFLLGLTTNSKLTNGNPTFFWKNVSLLNIQQDGESQKIMTEKFSSLILKQFGVVLSINDFSKDHYIYVDDLLFSGMKLRTDLTYFLERAPANAKIDVIYIGYFTSGEYYVKEKWFKDHNQKNIDLNIWRMFELENRNNCNHASDILLPTIETVEEEQVIVEFIRSQGSWVTRDVNGTSTSKCVGNNLFSSEENRRIIEKEFTLAGLKINSSIRDQKKKAYWKPLGLSTFKGLGFGAMITTYRNCPNNTPLALWWGDWDNNQTWTPLFNRKTYNRGSMHHE